MTYIGILRKEDNQRTQRKFLKQEQQAAATNINNMDIQTVNTIQGPKLRPAGRQCDWKFSVGDQNFKASRQQATNF